MELFPRASAGLRIWDASTHNQLIEDWGIIHLYVPESSLLLSVPGAMLAPDNITRIKCGEIWIKLQQYFSQENVFENALCKISDILNRSQWTLHHDAEYYMHIAVRYTHDSRAPSQYKDRLIYVWRFPC